MVALVVDGVPFRTPPTVQMWLSLPIRRRFMGIRGPAGDHGILMAGKVTVNVTDTQKKLGDLYVHLGTVAGGR